MTAQAENPWDAGAETPCGEALKSALFIHPVPPAEKAALKFTVTEQMGIARGNAPVRGGLPFRRGELADAKNIRLLGPDGKELPVQGLVTSYWPENTVRWLCIDLLADIDAHQTETFTLEYGTAVKPAKSSPLRVTEKGGTIEINTGKMAVSFGPGQRFSGPVKRAGGGTRGDIKGVLVISRPSEAAAPVELALHVEEAKLVENGPVQATVYLRGGYGNEAVRPGPFRQLVGVRDDLLKRGAPVPRFAFHGFVRVYGDTCRMEVVHSFGYNGDEDRDFVRRYGLVIPVKAARAAPFIYGGDLGRRREAALSTGLTLTQGRHNWWTLTGDAKAKGNRFGGWAALRAPAGHVTAALRNAWQQWPVTLQARPPGDLVLYIYGAPEGEFLDLRYQGEHFGRSRSMYVGPRLSDTYGGGKGRAAGLLKISELTLDFEADPADAGAGAHMPLVPFAGPKRIAETKALGHIGTYQGVKGSPAAKKLGLDIDEHVRWARTLLDFPVIQHEANGYYGWVDWPDQGDCGRVKDGRFQMIMLGGIGWTNSERALPAYYFHYVAGGLEKYLHLGHAMTLHTIGIDMEHPGGEMTPGVLHRHNQVHWRSGGEPRQCGVRGWYADYWMTGNPEVRRILMDVYQPHYRPRPGPGPDPVLVTCKGTAHNYPNLLAYLTTNDPMWIKHHKAIDQAIFTKASKGLSIPYSRWRGGQMFWRNGSIRLVKTAPGRIGGYWCTYGGDDRLAEHASLFGYEISLKALKAWGDSLFGDGDKPPRNSSSGYASPEAGLAAYYVLTRKAEVPHWLAGQITTRPPRTCLSKNGELIHWDAYTVKGTADDWQRLWGKEHGWPPRHLVCYGKNAFKIQAANIFESIYALAAIQAAGR